MKESILGLATIAILFGVVWLSQSEVYTSKYQSQNNFEISEKLDSDQSEDIDKSDIEISDQINENTSFCMGSIVVSWISEGPMLTGGWLDKNQYQRWCRELNILTFS